MNSKLRIPLCWKARLLGGTGTGGTITERLKRDLWVDYVSDTGDDAAVSRAVARLLFAEYELPDPAAAGTHLLAPRGDVLLFGGDTAYPVATADEIRDRVIAPFNAVLAERNDGRRRVLMGIPGNHDWYDGLDGFGRMFRRHVDYDETGTARPTLHGSTRTLLGHYAEWAREFVRGGQVDKPSTLDLLGYTAVQGASYFVLPVAPAVTLLAVDRQLKNVDSRQEHFFKGWLNQHLSVSPWVVLPDPVYAFGVPSATGVQMTSSLQLSLAARPHLVLSGDIHHYRREQDGPTLHVTAGGGGAFLHPAPIARKVARPAAVEWPDAAQSRALLWQVPWKVAIGRSGVLPHLAFAALLAPIVFAPRPLAALVTAGVIAAVLTVGFVLIGGAKGGRGGVVPLALAVAAASAGAGLLLRRSVKLAAAWLSDRTVVEVPSAVSPWIALGLAVLFAAWLFGVYLALLTLFGYQNTQAFTALDHPGFKHFVRFRVRADGSAIDGWCIGLVDPVGEPEPVLVDAFTWKAR